MTGAYELEFVESFPQPLVAGVFYVSTRFASGAHLCASGCGREVITPLSPAQWSITFDGKLSVWPSIGNWSLPCRSHYVIRRGLVRWARDFSNREIADNRDADERRLDVSKGRGPRSLKRNESGDVARVSEE